MSLLNQLRSRIGLGDDGGASERARQAARRTGERVRNVDTERARRATVRASESLAADPPGRVRAPQRTSREQDVAERAGAVASMQGPVDATLEPADSMGIDRLARADRGQGSDQAEDAGGPRADDLATNVGGQPEADGGLFDFSPSEPPDEEWGWL